MFTHQQYYSAPAPFHSSNSSRPRVGLAVICRCSEGNTSVYCLLQKRGTYSNSPNKWSFPGGRLSEPSDAEDDGAAATRKKLEEECGHGSPPGLPPLIHIECCKSGKAKQTLYHVFVVDTSTDKLWDQWSPRPNEVTCTNIDLSSPELVLHGQTFPCFHGYCWADLSLLIEECFELVTTPGSPESDLQYGLVRWIYTYGEHILKTLIARSPKIPHTRRLSNPGTPLNGTTILRPRIPKPSDNLIPRPYRYGVFGPRASLPPLIPIPYPMSSAPIYRMPQHNVGPLSPTGSVGGLPHMHSPLHNVGVHETHPNVLLPLHHQGQPNFMFYGPHSSIPIHSTMPEKIPLMQSAPGLLQQAPGLMQQPPGILQQVPPGLIHHPPPAVARQSSNESFNTQQFLHSSSPTHLVAEVTEGAPPINPQLPPRSNLVSEVSPTPVIMPTPQNISMLGHTHQNVALDPHQLSVLGPGHMTALGNHEQALLPLATAQVPLHDDKMSRQIPVRGSNSGPLLPNPPVMPHHPPPQNNHRKETVCKFYVSGAGICPYGEKCWFAHPEPIGSIPSPTHRGYPESVSSTAGGYGYRGTLATVAQAGQTTVWMNGQMVQQYGMTSPPQSPLSTGVVTVPSGHLGTLPPPRHSYPQAMLASHQQQQQQLMLLQQQQRPMMQPIPTQQNPILRFELLTDLRMVDENRFPVVKISQQTSRADQLYVSFGPHVHNYKILFGGNRPSTQSFYLVDDTNLSEIVSCVHCSRHQPGLLVVGTETGSINLWELKRGNGHSVLSDVHRNIIHPNSLPKPDEAITSLVQFSTFTNSSVVVAGTRGGTLTWYIAQPPQKTFSVLYTDKNQHAQHSIVALQLQGSHLLSGDSGGRVALWSMQTQTPLVQGAFYAHSVSLFNLHVIDGTHFLTIGTGSVSSDNVHPSTPSGGQSEGGKSVVPPLDSLAGDISNLSIADTTTNSTTGTTTSSHDLNKFNINLWQFPKLVSSWTEEGVVNSTSFHIHTPPGNMFLAVGLQGGKVKIFNLPSFKIASELHFPEMKGSECSHITINHSRETPIMSSVYYRNPFRDLILTTVWSDGRIMVCQVAKQVTV